MAQSNQKRKGCQIIVLYFTFRHHAPPLKAERERERERGRKYVHQEGTAADPVEKVLMSLFLFTFFTSSLGSQSPQILYSQLRTYEGSPLPRTPGAALDPLGMGTYTVLRPLAITGCLSNINDRSKWWK